MEHNWKTTDKEGPGFDFDPVSFTICQRCGVMKYFDGRYIPPCKPMTRSSNET